MRRELPEVIALQEVRHNWCDLPGHNQAQWFADRLGYQWLYRPANIFWPLPPVSEGLAALTREAPLHWSAHPAPYVSGSGPRRVVLRLELAGLDVYTVHFPLGERARELAARHLVHVVRQNAGKRALIVGDFNADPWAPPMTYLRAQGFVDLWSHWNGMGNDGTQRGWTPGRRIDYTLAFGASDWRGSMRLVGVDPAADGALPSDHPGLVVDLE